MRRTATQLLALVALSVEPQARGVLVEVYYGPSCPSSATYLANSMQPFLDAGIPDVVLTVLPYTVDPATHALPRPCPSDVSGSPCGVLAAPLCALSPFLASMPSALTPEYMAALKFAVCDLIHASHGAPAWLTHTPTDIQQCSANNGADWGAISGCMAHAVASSLYVAQITAVDAKLPPGTVAPWVFVDGQLVETTTPLATAVCRKLGAIPACLPFIGASEVTGEVAPLSAHVAGSAPMLALPPLVLAVGAAAFLVGRAAARRQAEPEAEDEEERRLLFRVDHREDED